MRINDTQTLDIGEYYIKIRDTTNPNSANPVGVVTLSPGLQVRIGQSYNLLIQCLMRAQTFVMLNPTFRKGDILVVSILRQTGTGISNEPLGALTVCKDTIISYQYNQKAYGPYTLPAMQRLRFKGDPSSVAKQIATTLSAMLKVKLSSSNWGIKYEENKIQVYLKSDQHMLGKHRLYYFASRGVDGLYFINTVGYGLSELLRAEG